MEMEVSKPIKNNINNYSLIRSIWEKNSIWRKQAKDSN